MKTGRITALKYTFSGYEWRDGNSRRKSYKVTRLQDHKTTRLQEGKEATTTKGNEGKSEKRQDTPSHIVHTTRTRKSVPAPAWEKEGANGGRP